MIIINVVNAKYCKNIHRTLWVIVGIMNPSSYGYLRHALEKVQYGYLDICENNNTSSLRFRVHIIADYNITSGW